MKMKGHGTPESILLLITVVRKDVKKLKLKNQNFFCDIFIIGSISTGGSLDPCAPLWLRLCVLGIFYCALINIFALDSDDGAPRDAENVS